MRHSFTFGFTNHEHGSFTSFRPRGEPLSVPTKIHDAMRTILIFCALVTVALTGLSAERSIADRRTISVSGTIRGKRPAGSGFRVPVQPDSRDPRGDATESAAGRP